MGQPDILKIQELNISYCLVCNIKRANNNLRIFLKYNFKRKSSYNRLIKSVWGMPRLSEAMKDVISCEKLRGVAHTL